MRLVKRSQFLIYSIYFLVLIYFSTYWAVYQGLIGNSFSRIPEIFILSITVILISSMNNRSFNFVGNNLILPFILVMLISAIINSTPVFELLLFIKNIFIFYFVLLLIANVKFSKEELIRILKFIYAVFLFQIPVAILKLVLFGQNETPLGFVGSNLTSYFFLMSEAFSFSFFLTTGKKKYIFHSILLLAIPLIGGKRVAIFILPILFLIMFLIYSRAQRTWSFKNLYFALLVLVVGTFLFIRIIPTLNPERKVWGQFDIVYALEYGRSYSNAYDPYKGDVAIGRNAAIKNAVKILGKENNLKVLFGIGPGAIAKTSIDELDNRSVITEKFKIRYGTNSFIYFLVQTGWLGTLLMFLFYLSFITRAYVALKSSPSPFWSSFYLIVISFTLIFSFFAFYYDAVHKMGVIILFYYIVIGMFVSLENIVDDNDISLAL